MVVYLFIVLVAYFTISSPFENLVSGFEGTDTLASDEIEDNVSLYRSVFNMFFALLGLVPIIWFIVWIFHREPDWSYVRR